MDEVRRVIDQTQLTQDGVDEVLADTQIRLEQEKEQTEKYEREVVRVNKESSELILQIEKLERNQDVLKAACSILDRECVELEDAQTVLMRSERDFYEEIDALAKHAEVVRKNNEELSNELTLLVETDELARLKLERSQQVTRVRDRNCAALAYSHMRVARSRSPEKQMEIIRNNRN